MLWNDAVFLTGLRHLITVPAALFPIWLGYKLYLHGVSGQSHSFGFRAPLTKFVVSGCGPGATFMCMGGAVLLLALLFGARSSAREQIIGLLVADTDRVPVPGDATKKARMVNPDLSAHDADQLLNSRDAVAWLEEPRGIEDLETVPLSTLESAYRLRALDLVDFDGEYLRLSAPGEQSSRQLADLAACDRDARRLSVPTSAVQLPLNAPLEANFDEYSDMWYLLSIEESAMYSIRTSLPSYSSNPVDTELTLYEWNNGGLGEQIGYDDDQGEGTFSLLNENLDQGTYWLKVSSYCATRGSFAVEIVMYAASNDAECESIPAESNVLHLRVDQGPVSGALDSDGHVWYRFAVEEEGQHQILTSSDEVGQDVDTVLRLFRRDGDCLREIGFDDDGAAIHDPMGSSLFSLLSEDLDPISYWIEVSSFLSDSGNYRVQVTSGERE